MPARLSVASTAPPAGTTCAAPDAVPSVAWPLVLVPLEAPAPVVQRMMWCWHSGAPNGSHWLSVWHVVGCANGGPHCVHAESLHWRTTTCAPSHSYSYYSPSSEARHVPDTPRTSYARSVAALQPSP